MFRRSDRRGAIAPPRGRHVTRLALVGIALAASGAEAWGGDGHRIVGEIAWHHLTPVAKREVDRLLPPGPYETLAEACTWADRDGRRFGRYRWLEPMHYVHLSPGLPLDEGSCPGGACLLAAIVRFREELTDSRSDHQKRVMALRLLGHFVGDVHQPLHVVAFRDMRGGNDTRVAYAKRKGTSLHELWDSVLLEEGMNRLYRRGGNLPGGKTDLWRRLAADLIRVKGTGSPGPYDPRAWAEESLALSQGPLFDVLAGQRLEAEYGREAFVAIERRLLIAGLRLASVLNTAFDRSPESP